MRSRLAIGILFSSVIFIKNQVAAKEPAQEIEVLASSIPLGAQDYSFWPITSTAPFSMAVSMGNEMNSKPSGPIVVLGTSTIRRHPIYPNEQVQEYDILGNGVVVRTHGRRILNIVWYYTDIPRNGRWTPVGSSLYHIYLSRLYITNYDRFQKDGIIEEVLISFRPFGFADPPVELRLKNRLLLKK